jgi:hypothetical protein
MTNDSLIALPADCCIDCCMERMEKQRAQGVFPIRQFIACPECGNKRCPKATNHNNACTGSNEPGQAGSAYQ